MMNIFERTRRCTSFRSGFNLLAYHRFKIAQTITSIAPDIPTGPFVIVRLLPHIDREPQYRVTSTIDGHQRTIPESQIRLAPRAESQPPSVRFVLSMHAVDDATIGHEERID